MPSDLLLALVGCLITGFAAGVVVFGYRRKNPKRTLQVVQAEELAISQGFQLAYQGYIEQYPEIYPPDYQQLVA